jgi:hexosaminidase
MAMHGQVAPLAHASSVTNLMPVPAHIQAGQGSLKLERTFAVCANAPADARLQNGVSRLLLRMAEETNLDLARVAQCGGPGATLRITVDGPGEAVQSETEDESYELKVEGAGIQLHAKTTVGALRGLETLLQLVEVEEGHWSIPAVQVTDAPRFQWRGLMLDSGRHFEPVSVIHRTLDGMAAVKLNVFHWHLTEDQGFRIESKRFPLLTGMASGGQYYTQEQEREIVAYARDRGIRVIPEFDMPGHSTSWLVGYPRLGSRVSGGYTINPLITMEKAAMNPALESTYAFLDAFLGEMTTIFPDAYIHIGGDETNGSEWQANPQIQAFMKSHRFATNKELQAYFNQRIERILAKHGRKMLGWDEILNANLPGTITVQTWHEPQFVIDSAVAGHPAIFSSKTAFYLDHMLTAEQMYAADPIPSGQALTPQQRKLILGGEVCMWGEQINEHSVDSRIWPRSAAVAERLWSPQDVRDADDMYRRLALESLRLEALGLTHLSAEDVGLRQIAGNADVADLKTFAAVVQPVNIYERSRSEHTTLTMPFAGLVDVIRPDPPERHQFILLADRYINKRDVADRLQLASAFQAWAVASQNLQLEAPGNPKLDAVCQRIQQLQQLSEIGQQVVIYLASGKSAPAEWVQSTQAKLKDINKSREMIDFVVIDPLQSLVMAAAKGQ